MGRHHSANVTVNVEGDEAELSSYFATSGAYGWGGGVYQMTLRSYPEQKKWLIQQMRIVSTWGWRIAQEGPPYLANGLGNLATHYSNIGQEEKAVTLYLRALKIREDKLGKEHPYVVNDLNNLVFSSENKLQSANRQIGASQARCQNHPRGRQGE